jgi:hypothetical protein
LASLFACEGLFETSSIRRYVDEFRQNLRRDRNPIAVLHDSSQLRSGWCMAGMLGQFRRD